LFEKTPLKAQNDYIFQIVGGHGPPLATPMLSPSFNSVVHFSFREDLIRQPEIGENA